MRAPDVPGREPLRGAPPGAAPPSDFQGARQWALLVVIAALLFAAAFLGLLAEYVYASLAVIAAVIAITVFLRGAGGSRDRRNKGPETMKIPFISRPADGGSPAGQPPMEGAQHAAATGVLEGGTLPDYQPGTQGHPLGPPKGQHLLGRIRKPHNEGDSGPAAPQAGQLPGPPVFGAPSKAGQASWHLPVGAAPSGLAADGIRLGDLEVRAASMVGAGHRCMEPAVARQDAYALSRTTDGRFLVIAVADGVGQSKHADLAARIAVNAATRELAAVVESEGPMAVDAVELYRRIAGEMIGTGRDRGIKDADVCAILITAVIPASPGPDGMRPVWATWIGDVSLWVSRDGELTRVTGQDKDGLDRNALHAVLPFSPDQVNTGTLDVFPQDRVALMTDGVSDSLTALDGAMAYFARQWAGPPPHPAAFLHSLCYDGPTQSDDRTAVVVWCGDGDPGGRRAAQERR